MPHQSWVGRLTTSGEIVRVTVKQEHIESIERLRHQSGRDEEGMDPNIPWISAGWIDLQVNGFAGFDFNEEHTTERDVIGVAQALYACGVTTFMPTVITGSRERIEQAMLTLAKVCDSDAWIGRSIAGIHLEGPYISAEDGPRGAHLRRFVRDPDLAEFHAWQQAAGNRIRMVTIAPERTGALAIIAELARKGIVAAIGHTAAASDQIEQAVEAGAAMSTHLGNGSHTQLPRHPNYIWDQLANDGLWAGFIADGHHIPPQVLKVMLRAKKEKAILVSDAVKLAGMPPGRYSTVISGLVEVHPNGRLSTVSNPNIFAGSSASLADGVANAVAWGGVSLAEAVEMVTLRPAMLMGFDKLGRLEPGAAANLTLFEWPLRKSEEKETALRIHETVLAGRTMYKAGNREEATIRRGV